VALRKLWAYWDLPVRARRIRGRHGVCSTEEFHTILDRERARANRNGHGFSLMVFDVESPDTALARRLLHVLTHRLRSTDEVGWLDGRRVGVILPDTLPAGARRLAEELYQLMGTETSQLDYRLYTYPSQEPWHGDQHASIKSH
jgi:hypothetical protein